ncbi:hypothetical protein JGH11_10570 [Dysgonomonas sp. Marseille-P4677]|uniref:primase-helicase family protein n=1 Tax=Dysgonomonas sp. Marseille-P4677 TaxID=2364790 RepID=UPI001911A8F5|nr:primase-helicase family protein [Dysgonomonas sp. Marseille-P4677]MBK5721315.1 hypothetical protein [Dysgonomonas sp. Marseille-P4677]
MITPKDLYDKTNQGLDIILHFYPQAREVYNRKNVPFKIRETDDTPSAYIKLITGRNGETFWRVTDYGVSEQAMSPVDICMNEKDMKLPEAIHYLANLFNVVPDAINPEINKADFRKSPATEDEPDGFFVFVLKEKMSDSELKVLGPHVKQEHCDLLKYSAVEYYKTTRNRQTTTISSNENYPIFIRECRHIEHGKEARFYKIYQPLNSDKKYRFFYSGEKPQKYINGLFELKAIYQKFNDDEEKRFRAVEGNENKDYKMQKLPEAFICSGERDALCVKAHNYIPLWFNSEGYKLAESEYREINRYVERIYQIPDIDETGVRLGLERALKYMDIYTVWLPDSLRKYYDQRGKPRKDFRDFCEIKPEKDRFRDLLNLARPVRFWEYVEEKGKKKLDINSDYVTYFLRCNGFVAIDDKNSKSGRMFARIEGNTVKEIRSADIKDYLLNFVTERYMPVEIRNAVNNSTRLTESNIKLNRVELNFDDYTPHSQFFFFQNATWEVTASQVKEYKPGVINRQVWDEEMIKHPVKRLEPSFAITKEIINKGEDDESVKWDIKISESNSSNFLKYLINASRIFWRKEFEIEGELPDQLQQYKDKFKFAIDGERLSPEEIAEQKQHLINKIFCLGYLLHRYKAENRSWCVFAMDNKIAENDESNGGSGKSFCFKALRLFMKSVTLSGRNPKLTENNHIYENVTEHTDYILIDDADQYLPFGFFFDAVTGDLTVNPKFTKSYEISFDKAAKFCITSNYTLRKFDPSTERRILYAVFSDYYHQKTADNDYKETRTIYDDFKKNLFRENYTDAEWNADINFFVDCCQFYLSIVGDGVKIQPPMANVIDRNLRTEMTDVFYNWAEVYFSPGSPNCDNLIERAKALKDFMDETKQGKWTTNKFTKALKAYCRYAPHILELDPVEFKNSQGRIIRKSKTEKDKPVEMIYVRTQEEINFIENDDDDNTTNNGTGKQNDKGLPF